MSNNPQTTEPMTTEGWIKLQEHNKWLQSELDRYQSAGCVAVAERLKNQGDRISLLKENAAEAIRLLNEALHA